MNFIMPIFSAALPEVVLLSLVALIMLVDVALTERYRVWTYLLAQAALIATFILIIWQYQQHESSLVTFAGNYIVDKLALILKGSITLLSIFAFAYSREYLIHHKIIRGEYYILGLLAVLGMLVMASSYSLLLMYLGLELLSLSLYAMVALQKESTVAAEAAMKFFIMGSLASGLLLYGMSMLYGATGSIQIAEIANIIQNSLHANQPVIVLALIFMLVGLIFKFGAVPFHMWVPDVYHGAATPVTLFIASAPKIAAFGITIRVLVEALAAYQAQWVVVLTIVALLSMFFGNLFAIAQTNIKRMLAYSSIAHIGYMLLGIVAGPHSVDGYSAALFYIATYVIMAAGGFAIITILSRTGIEFDQLKDYRGLNARNPWVAFMMLLIMFSMAGIPPTVGFFAKLGLLEALVEAHMAWLAALALLSAIIGAYYYLRIVMLMYFEEPEAELAGTRIVLSSDMMVAISINGACALALGILPSALIDLCRISFG